MRRIILILVCVAACISGTFGNSQSNAQGSVEKPFLHPLFSDNMVLQRKVKFPVWGWTTPGALVTVKMQGKSSTAVADGQGKWLAWLGPFEAGGPYTLLISGPQTQTLNNVLVGDVWLASGQSNMEMGISQVNNAKEEIANAGNPQIRLFSVPKVISAHPLDTVKSRWEECNPSTITVGGWGGFSAVAYFFGRRLQHDLGVPIGLIHSSWGGTVAEGWISAEALSTLPDFQSQVKALTTTIEESKGGPTNLEKLMDQWWRKNDPGSVTTPGWADPSFDDTTWKQMNLPEPWDDAALPGYDGVVWYRKKVNLSADWTGSDAVLNLGAIDDRDTAFVNGVQVGATNQFDAPRSYPIRAGLLKPGWNTIAVRVLDTGLTGGFTGKPEQMNLSPIKGNISPVSLTGEWRYRPSATLAETDTPPQPPGNDLGLVVARYNGMIAPLLPFAIKGVIWYQGESNVGRGEQYKKVMATLIRDWRERFSTGDFPFLIVQLPNYMKRRETPTDSEWARLREAQLYLSQTIPHVGLAVTIELGGADELHPKNKQDVGNRLAMVALSEVYGRKAETSGPVFRSMKIQGNAIHLAFDHTDGGLIAKDGERLTGFAIAGDDRSFMWADAVIKGNEVVVSSPSVAKPIAVRYAWADNPACNLYNKAGLPASPFRTDDFPRASARSISQR